MKSFKRKFEELIETSDALVEMLLIIATANAHSHNFLQNWRRILKDQVKLQMDNL